MSEKKTTLTCLWKQKWKTVKPETEKVNNLLTNIPKNHLIYEGAKLVSKKIGVPLKTSDRKSNPGRQLRLESQIKKDYDNNQEY